MKKALLGATVAFGLLSTQAVANSVSNGGFETGDLSGWSCTGGPLGSRPSTCAAATAGAPIFLTPHSGTYSVFAFSNDSIGSLSQSISTVAGMSYQLSFYSKATRNASANLLDVSIGGASPISIALSLSYVQSVINFVATGSSTSIAFLFQTDSGTGGWSIDDVDVSSAAAVPVPAALPLLASGLGVIGFAGWRRQRRSEKQDLAA